MRHHARLKFFLLMTVVTLAVTTLPQATAQALSLSWQTTVSSALTDSSVTYGQPTVITGSVNPDGSEDRTVELHRLGSDGSTTLVRSALTDADGQYAIPVPSNRVGTTRWVVVAPETDRYRGGTSDPAELTVHRRSSRLSTFWHRTRTTLHRRATVTGRVLPTADRRRVEAIMWLPGGWRRVASGWTDSAGRYSLRLPTWWYHTKTVRVVAPATRSAGRVVSGNVRQRVAPSYRPRGRATDWAPLDRDLRMRWNPCRTVTWRFNFRGAPRGAFADARRAMSRVTRATGIRFHYVGRTRVIPGTSKGWPRGTGIVIAYSRPWQSKWNLRGRTVGQGGPTKLVAGRDARGDMWRIQRGGVVMDASQWLRPGFGVGDSRGRVMMHEIGHVLGLGHAGHRSEMMVGTANPDIPARWGAGDLRGLSRMGLSQGCVWPR